MSVFNAKMERMCVTILRVSFIYLACIYISAYLRACDLMMSGIAHLNSPTWRTRLYDACAHFEAVSKGGPCTFHRLCFFFPARICQFHSAYHECTYLRLRISRDPEQSLDHMYIVPSFSANQFHPPIPC